MPEKPKPNYRIYTTIGGVNLAAEEISRENGIIKVRGAAYIEIHPSMTKFNLQPLRFIDPTKSFTLYQTALLGEQELPAILMADFQKYIESTTKE